MGELISLRPFGVYSMIGLLTCFASITLKNKKLKGNEISVSHNLYILIFEERFEVQDESRWKLY